MDHVVFGGGGAVTVRPEINANPFNALKEEVTFFGVEREAPFREYVAYTGEIKDKGKGVVAEKEDIVDNLAVAGLDKFDFDEGIVKVGEPFLEQGLPFLPYEEHEDGVASGSVDRAEGHGVEGVQDASGANET